MEKDYTFLKDPISRDDLMESGCRFETINNCDENVVNDFCEEINFDFIIGENFDDNNLISPWMGSFDELKKHMVEINPYLWKRITKSGCSNSEIVPVKNARVNICYNAYWQGERTPFDSTYLRNNRVFSFITGVNDVLEGLELAVCTMHVDERAEFIISYHKLFREMGCPPRIKPKADGLFIIELVTYKIISDIDMKKFIEPIDRNTYSLIRNKVRDIHLNGLDLFNRKMYHNAIRAFEKAVDILNSSHLANETEEIELNSLLLKLYTNLAVCFNKLKIPNKTCLICKEIRRITENNPSCKALFQEGRALLMMGEYTRARKLLTKAQNLEPFNQEISKEIILLENRYERIKENNDKFLNRAMDVIKSAKSIDYLTDLKKELENLMLDFKKDISQKEMKLPLGLTDEEIEMIKSLAESMDLEVSSLRSNPLNETYKIIKS